MIKLGEKVYINGNITGRVININDEAGNVKFTIEIDFFPNKNWWQKLLDWWLT